MQQPDMEHLKSMVEQLAKMNLPVEESIIKFIEQDDSVCADIATLKSYHVILENLPANDPDYKEIYQKAADLHRSIKIRLVDGNSKT